MEHKKILSDAKLKILDELQIELNKAFDEKRYFESALLRFVEVDNLLRFLIGQKVVTLIGDVTGETWGDWWERSNLLFSELIRNCKKLKIFNADFLNILKKYNNQRNNIVHGVIYFDSFEQVQKTAKENTEMGMYIIRKILLTIYDEKCVCGKDEKYKDCHGKS